MKTVYEFWKDLDRKKKKKIADQCNESIDLIEYRIRTGEMSNRILRAIVQISEEGEIDFHD